MKAILKVFVLLILASCSGLKFVAHKSLPAQIEEIINHSDPHVNIGIKIMSLTDNQVVYERNADRHFVPASTIKLATVAAALYYLGPSYRFDTTIFIESFESKPGRVKNIYLQGSGDPSLMDHDLTSLAHELKQKNITHIKGHIYVDDYIFDDTLWSRGTMWDDRKFGFCAPVSGLNINYNRLVIKTVPAHKLNMLAHTIIKPATKYISVSSRAQTKGQKDTQSLTMSLKNAGEERPWTSVINEGLSPGDHIFINGTMPINAAPFYSLLAIKDPSLLAGTFFKEQLQHVGIEFRGQVLRKKTPARAIKIASHQSRALSEALIDFTKISNNLAHDALVKAIAAQAGEKPATFSGGLALVSEFLSKEVGITKNSMITADGSGISRYNLMTPDQMLKILAYAAHRFSMGPEFMASMPLAGQDGTLGKRLSPLAGSIRAKTGSLTNVSGLAGYYVGDHHKRFAFAIFINGFTGLVSKYTKLQDDLLSALLPAPIVPAHNGRLKKAPLAYK